MNLSQPIRSTYRSSPAYIYPFLALSNFVLKSARSTVTSTIPVDRVVFIPFSDPLTGPGYRVNVKRAALFKRGAYSVYVLRRVEPVPDGYKIRLFRMSLANMRST